MSDSLLALFCHVDDFCQAFGPHRQQRLLAYGVRHRSVLNFFVNLLCGLIAYCHQPKKPPLHSDAVPALPLA